MLLILCIQNVYEYLNFFELECYFDLVVLLQGIVFLVEEFDVEVVVVGMCDVMMGFGECVC